MSRHKRNIKYIEIYGFTIQGLSICYLSVFFVMLLCKDFIFSYMPDLFGCSLQMLQSKSLNNLIIWKRPYNKKVSGKHIHKWKLSPKTFLVCHVQHHNPCPSISHFLTLVLADKNHDHESYLCLPLLSYLKPELNRTFCV